MDYEPLDEIVVGDVIVVTDASDISTPEEGGAGSFPGAGPGTNPVAADIELRDLIVPTVTQAWIDADDETDAFCVPNHRGTRSFQLQIKNIAPLLFSLGFTQEVIQGQVRFVNWDRYPHPVRVLFCRGFKLPGGYEVCPKGSLSRDLIQDENKEWVNQTSLFDEDAEEDTTDQVFQNYWVVSEFYANSGQGNYLTIYLGLPISLSLSGTRMGTLSSVVLFNGGISSVDPNAIELPIAHEIEFDISEAGSGYMDNNLADTFDEDSNDV